MIGEDLQKFSRNRVMITSAICRVPIRNLPKKVTKYVFIVAFTLSFHPKLLLSPFISNVVSFYGRKKSTDDLFIYEN